MVYLLFKITNKHTCNMRRKIIILYIMSWQVKFVVEYVHNKSSIKEYNKLLKLFLLKCYLQYIVHNLYAFMHVSIFDRQGPKHNGGRGWGTTACRKPCEFEAQNHLVRYLTSQQYLERDTHTYTTSRHLFDYTTEVRFWKFYKANKCY